MLKGCFAAYQYSLASQYTLKMTGETPEVRSDKRKPKMEAMEAMAPMHYAAIPM